MLRRRAGYIERCKSGSGRGRTKPAIAIWQGAGCLLYYELIDNLFAYHGCRYCEDKLLEMHILSDQVLVDFYKLAGEYGKIHDIAESSNPFVQEAKQQVCERLDFSYCLGWRLAGHANPRRQYHSRLALFISQEDCLDLGCLAYGLLEIKEWFADRCADLRRILHKREAMAK